MPKKEFMEKYCNAVLAQYHIPTAKEVKKWEEENEAENGDNEQTDLEPDESHEINS